MIDEEEKETFNKQLDIFIREIQEDLHLSYEETIRMIIDSILNSSRFREEFYILNNETWDEESVWIGNMKIIRRKAYQNA